MQRESNIILVIDVGNPSVDGMLTKKNVLNGISHTLLPMYELVKQCEELGITCVTPDAILNRGFTDAGKELLLISHLTSTRTNSLLSHGVKPFLLFCQESPMIATRFYVNLRKISRIFKYTMVFNGMKRIHPQSTFIPMHFPVHYKPQSVGKVPFSEKKLLTLIAGNKQASSWKIPLIKWFYGSNVKLIYPIRKRLIKDLTKVNAIDLYGMGWNLDQNEIVRAAWKGIVPAGDKYATLSKYRFTLCFENAIFPGYLTEKIFDAFISKCIPIYLGDPEITKNIPKDAFLNAREFKNTEELHQYLANMSEEEYEGYLTAAQNFLQSSLFNKFRHETFVETVVTLIQHHDYQS